MSARGSTADDPLRVAAILNAVMVASALAQFAVAVMAPAIAPDLGISAAWLGTYSTIMWTASLSTSAAAGHLIGRFGGWRIAQAVLVVSALGLVAAALGNAPVFVLAAILVGLGLGVETPASSSILAAVTPPERAPFIFSFKQTGIQTGGMAAGALLPVIGLAFGWRVAFGCTAALIACAALLLEPRCRAAGQRERPVGRPASFRRALRLTVEDPALLRLALVALSFVGAQVCFLTFLVSYFVADHGVTLVQAGKFLAVGQFGGLVGRLAWGVVAGRWIRPITLLAVLGVGIAGVCLGLAFSVAHMSHAAVYALAFAGGLTVSGWNGIYLAELARLAPRGQVGQFTGASFLLSTFGLVVAPTVFSSIAARTDYGTGFLFATALAVVGVIVLAIPGRRRDAGL